MHDEAAGFGLDTSVVLRLIAGDPPWLTETALRFLDKMKASETPVVVADLVVAEAYYALSHHYSVPKPVALARLLAMFDSGLVHPETGSRVVEILKLALSSSKKPGFVDRLIHAQYRKASRQLVTFEKATKRLVGTVLLK